MEFKVLNWNIAGAKFLEEADKEKKGSFREKLNEELASLIKRNGRPHVITLQEIVEYCEPGKTKENIIDTPGGYIYYPCILIDTIRHPYVSKWKNVQDKGKWPDGSYFGQGNATLWRKDLLHFPVWSLPKIDTTPDANRHVEEVILNSGLYFGDRNTEPRAALVAHFMITKDFDTGKELEEPLDVFVVNLHLTTLKMEREGIPKIDEAATKIRSAQLDTIFNGIVSRYNHWRRGGYRFRGDPRKPKPDEEFNRYSPIWILCGDFNFTPESVEYARMKRMNFVDVHEGNKGRATKGSGYGPRAKATITCDYIFAGPKFISLDPLIIEVSKESNPKPDYSVRVSDHYPLFAEIPLTLL